MRITCLSQFTLGLLLLLSPSMSQRAEADLILVLDTTNKEFAFTGSATGTPQSVAGGGFTTWNLNGLGGSGSGPTDIFLNNDVAWSTNVGTPGLPAFALDTRLTSSTDNGGEIFLAFGSSTADAQTFTGTGVFSSYGSMSAGSQARLEGHIGQTLPSISGTGFGGVHIQAAAVAAVPEPSSFAFLSLGCVGVILHRRRRRSAAASDFA